MNFQKLSIRKCKCEGGRLFYTHIFGVGIIVILTAKWHRFDLSADKRNECLMVGPLTYCCSW